MPGNNKPRAIRGIKQRKTKTPTHPKGINYLFAIAINKYVHAPQLGNCLKDAEDFISLLTTRYQFSSDHVIRLFDEQATLPNIYNQLKELSKKIKEQDNLIIYFSGHGYMDKSDKSGHLVPVDGAKDAVWTYMSNDNLLSRIRAIKSFHTFLIIDSCFSGTLFLNRSMDSSALAEEVGRFPSRWGLAAGRIEEVADGYHGENSPFAKAVLSFLKTNTSAKFPVSELIQYVKKVTPRNSDQTPIGGPIFKAGDMDGEFIFELQGSEVVAGKEAVVALPVTTIENPSTIASATTESFFKKNGKYLWLLLLIPFFIWGLSKWTSNSKKETTNIVQPTTPVENKPTNLPIPSNGNNTKTEQLELNFEWGKNKIIADVKGGKPPYRISLKKDKQEKYHQDIAQAGKYNIAITKTFRKNAGAYQLVVKDEDGNRQIKTVTIDAPKTAIKRSGSFVDSRDSQVYKWVHMNDGKKWMTENLNFEIKKNSWCFDNDKENCKKYGRLYTWDAAMNACPTGWRLPSDEEWWNMSVFYGKARSKSKGNSDNNAGKNAYRKLIKGGESLFSVTLGGELNGERFSKLNTEGNYWNTDESSHPPGAFFYTFSQNTLSRSVGGKKLGLSCRCIQD